jgi:photosystem II stability/assembly factor-like uncharacterized protein
MRRSLCTAPFLICAALTCCCAAATDLTYQWGHPAPQGSAFFGLAFTDAQHGWSVCGGSILCTTDAGEHRQLQHGLREVADDLHDILATPAGTLIAVGAGIRRSSDRRGMASGRRSA